MIATLKQNEEFKELFFDKGVQYSYKKGEYIIRPGEIPSGIFYIETGLVKAYDITKSGEENMLIIRKAHEVFPLIWAITGQERHVIYEALDATTVRFVTRAKFINFIQEHPEALTPLLDMAIEMYRIHSERIINLGYRTVRERLVSFLLITAQRFGEKTPEGTMLLRVPLRHQDIASSINASRETTGREIGALERKGLVAHSGGYITILDVKAMRSYL